MALKPNSNKSNATYPKLGAILRNKEGGLYIKFSDDVEITVNGVNVSGKKASLEKPSVKYERMVAAGKMTPEEASRKISEYEDENGSKNFVRQEISIKLD